MNSLGINWLKKRAKKASYNPTIEHRTIVSGLLKINKTQIFPCEVTSNIWKFIEVVL